MTLSFKGRRENIILQFGAIKYYLLIACLFWNLGSQRQIPGRELFTIIKLYLYLGIAQLLVKL